MNPFPWLNGKAYKKIDGSQIVEKAREYIGTPWHHCGRKKGVGVDCVGLLACVGIELGVPFSDVPFYSQGDEFELMCECLEETCIEIVDDLKAGDILIFRRGPITNHCGVYTGEDTFIHAWSSPTAKRVVEQPLDATWINLIARVYRYGGCA